MALVSFSSGQVIKSADINSNFSLAVLTDTARTIIVTHSWTASQTFTGGWTAGAACTISTGGLTVTAGGATVTAGGLTVSAGGATVTGNSTITGTLTVSSTATVGRIISADYDSTYRGTFYDGASSITRLRIGGGGGANGLAMNICLNAANGLLFFEEGTGGTTQASISQAGVISASSFSGSLTGNADTATALANARTINGTSFDGTANITVTAAAGTLTGATLNSGVTASSLTSVGTLTALTCSGTATLKKLKGQSSAPGIANGAAIGSGGSVATSITGTDLAGKIVITAGTTSLTSGSLCTVTFNSAYSATPFVLIHYDNHSSSTVLAYGVANVSTTGFTIDVPAAPSVGQQFAFYYTVVSG